MRKPSGLPTTLVWFRLDLRLRDHPALQAAALRGGPVLPVFIWAPEEEGDWPPGAASRWWLHRSLEALAADLRARGSRLVLRRGPALETLRALARQSGARAVFWNRRYEPAILTREQHLMEHLRADGLEVESFNAALLREPWTLQTKSGGPYQVFTPFWRAHLALPDPPAPLPTPPSLPAPSPWPASLELETFGLLPRSDWAAGFRTAWQPGEAGATQTLARFGEAALATYAEGRNRPDLGGTSRLSPHLHFGEIGPRQIWQALGKAAPRAGTGGEHQWRQSAFAAELGWREFAHHLLYHFPRTPTEPLRAEFARFPWHRDDSWRRAWQRGHTGYPIVDAGMRELWATGWMHNRARMIVASFLVKDLRLDWREGARWFWDTLVDADLPNNTLGWQWTAGCGADAAPFFRIFNPVSQGRKFDPHGDYVRHWVPELAGLTADWIHRPWEAPAHVLADAGVALGESYPQPVVSHAVAREVALEAYARLKRGVSQ
jgi:deoxyribodipyrimidine photo-lyase